MTQRTCLSIILAAGEGTRMKSALPKVLHPIAGLPMVAHVVETASRTQGDIAIVTGAGAAAIRETVGAMAPEVEFFEQNRRLGTAHAVLAARDAIARGYDDVIVMFGDTPLVEPSAISDLRVRIAEGADVAVMGFEAPGDPSGYGRLIMDAGKLVAIREERDCSSAERTITFCNGGIMAISGKAALGLLEAIGNDNSKGEYYLTDIVALAWERSMPVTATRAAYENVLGVNTHVELAQAEAVWQARRRKELMLDGVTMIAPETVFLSHDTKIEADAVIEPNVVFGSGVFVAGGVYIRAFSHIEQAEIGPGAEVGPFARLRPGTRLGEKSKVGNFCEVKNAVVEGGAKINHLSYVGDAHVGEKANIGAGTITCNYDGFAKHRTEIGAGAFIGSNTSLVAPVTVGQGAYIASHSVVTDNVPDDAFAIGRVRQITKEAYGRRLKDRLESRK